jgi:hypothetical protein
MPNLMKLLHHQCNCGWLLRGNPTQYKSYIVKKRLVIFLSPVGMLLTKLSLAENYLDIPAGDGKNANLLFTMYALYPAGLPCKKLTAVA